MCSVLWLVLLWRSVSRAKLSLALVSRSRESPGKTDIWCCYLASSARSPGSTITVVRPSSCQQAIIKRNYFQYNRKLNFKQTGGSAYVLPEQRCVYVRKRQPKRRDRISRVVLTALYCARRLHASIFFSAHFPYVNVTNSSSWALTNERTEGPWLMLES